MRLSLLVLALVFGAAETFLVFFASPLIFYLIGPANVSTFQLVSSITVGVSFIIEPILIFVVMFLLGRKIELRVEYLSAFIALFVGALIGTAASAVILALVTSYILVGSVPFLGFFLNVMVFGGVGSLRLALVGFAGLAFSYLSGGRSQASPQPIV